MAAKARKTVQDIHGDTHRVAIVSSKRPTTHEEKMQIARLVCEMYATDKYSITTCSEHFGVSERTWMTWVEVNAEIAELYKEAKEKKTYAYKKGLALRGMTSLERLLEGGKTKSKRKRKIRLPDGSMVIGEEQTTKKTHLPHFGAVKMVLQATMPEVFTPDPVPTFTAGEINFTYAGAGPVPPAITSEAEVIDPLTLNPPTP